MIQKVKKSKEQPKSFILCYVIRKRKGARYKEASSSIYPTLFTLLCSGPINISPQLGRATLNHSNPVLSRVYKLMLDSNIVESHIFPLAYMRIRVISDYIALSRSKVAPPSQIDWQIVQPRLAWKNSSPY